MAAQNNPLLIGSRRPYNYGSLFSFYYYLAKEVDTKSKYGKWDLMNFVSSRSCLPGSTIEVIRKQYKAWLKTQLNGTPDFIQRLRKMTSLIHGFDNFDECAFHKAMEAYNPKKTKMKPCANP